MKPSEDKILSIQSHVVAGVVGNKGAAFILRVMGLAVDEIFTVQFSNPTSYKVYTGTMLKQDELCEIYDALKQNNLNDYSHLLTGYVRDKEVLMKYIYIIKDLRIHKNFKLYICDPVLGDNNKFYVNQELVGIYQNHILPHADIIVPNKFEAEKLSGLSLSHDSEDIKAVLKKLHSLGPDIVIISSIEGESSIITVSSKKNCDGTFDAFKVQYRKIFMNFRGTGDIFTALITGLYIKTGLNLEETTLKAVSVMQIMLELTKNEIGMQNEGLMKTILLEDLKVNLPIEKLVKHIMNPLNNYKIDSL